MGSLITNINQVGLVVKDVQKAAKIFSEGFGMDFLNVRFGHMEENPDFESNTISIENVYLDGERIGTYGIEMAAADFQQGPQLELIEPAGNRSLFQEYLDERGAGVQHIAVDHAEGFYEALGRMAAAGNPVGQFARVDGEQEECAFVKHRYCLGLDIELHNRLADFRLPEVTPNFIQADRERFSQPLLRRIIGLNFVMNRMESAVELLRDKYQMTGWRFEEAHGLKHGYCVEAGVELQLLEPLDESSHAAKILRRRGGCGVCSMEFESTAGGEEIRAALRRLGREPEEMFDHKIGADFTDILGIGLVFRPEK